MSWLENRTNIARKMKKFPVMKGKFGTGMLACALTSEDVVRCVQKDLIWTQEFSASAFLRKRSIYSILRIATRWVCSKTLHLWCRILLPSHWVSHFLSDLKVNKTLLFIKLIMKTIFSFTFLTGVIAFTKYGEPNKFCPISSQKDCSEGYLWDWDACMCFSLIRCMIGCPEGMDVDPRTTCECVPID